MSHPQQQPQNQVPVSTNEISHAERWAAVKGPLSRRGENPGSIPVGDGGAVRNPKAGLRLGKS